MAKSNAVIEIDFSVNAKRFTLQATFENQFELVYLAIDQMHDIRVYANVNDLSKKSQYPATILIEDSKSKKKCNLEITQSALLTLSQYNNVKSTEFLDLIIKYASPKLIINLHVPEHVCNTLMSQRHNLDVHGTEIAPTDSLEHMFHFKRKSYTPVTETEDSSHDSEISNKLTSITINDLNKLGYTLNV